MTGRRPLIALSIGDSPDLGRLGYGPEHVDALAIRLADELLRRGYDIAYGGQLRSRGFTETLQGVVKSHDREGNGPDGPLQARMVNYLPWPHHHALDAARTADALGMCLYVTIDPPEAPGRPAPKRGFESLADTYHAARSTTEMRRAMTAAAVAIDGTEIPAAAARVVLGGKVKCWSGILPGVAEEILSTLEAGKPVFVLGCFGGAARCLGRVLSGGGYPIELEKSHHEGEERFRRTCAAYDEHGRGEEIARRFEDLRERLADGWGKPDGRWVDNGLSVEENRKLLATEEVPTIKRLVRRGLEAVLERA